MKKILITGGAGFVGSHLCKKLLSNGDFVFVVDNLYSSTGENIKKFTSHKNFIFLKHDIINPMPFDGIDEIYHLACPASPIWYQKDPINTTKTGVIGSLNALELAKQTGAKILFTSTSEVYGDPLEHPQIESYWGNVNPCGVRSCYDESKRCAESLFYDYKRQHGLDIKIVRLFNVYGPNMAMNDGRVVSNFVIQALQNKDITIYGTGKQTRSFQYVDDAVNGIITMMNKKNFIGPVNIGNPNEFTLLELANNVIKLTKSKSKLTFLPLPKDDPKQRKPNISLAKSVLKWEPKIELNEGLKKTIEYFKLQLEKEKKSYPTQKSGGSVYIPEVI